MPVDLEGVRLRIPELLKEKGLTPYALSKRSGGRVSMSAAYRYVRLKGKLKSFDGQLLETLCDVLQCEPGELLEREKRKRGR